MRGILEMEGYSKRSPRIRASMHAQAKKAVLNI